MSLIPSFLRIAFKSITNPKETKRETEDHYDAGKAILSKKPRRSLLISKTKRKVKRMGEDWKRIMKP